MPEINRDSWMMLLDFFAELSSLSSTNKMDSLNIAKVMVPNLCKYEHEVPLEVEGKLSTDLHYKYNSDKAEKNR